MTDADVLEAADLILTSELAKVGMADPYDWAAQPKVDRRLTYPCGWCGHQRIAHQGDNMPGTHCRCCAPAACPRFKPRWTDVVIGWLWRLIRWLGP